MKSEHPNKLPQPGERYEVPAEGSLALLALGAKGLTAWRNKRAEVQNEQQKKSANGDEQKDA